jgi:hypothetical protein
LRVFRSLPHLGEADAILHVLQMVRMDPVAARVIRDRIVPFAGHDRLLVTVWAFDAYCRTAFGQGRSRPGCAHPAGSDEQVQSDAGAGARAGAGVRGLSMADMSAARAGPPRPQVWWFSAGRAP